MYTQSRYELLSQSQSRFWKGNHLSKWFCQLNVGMSHLFRFDFVNVVKECTHKVGMNVWASLSLSNQNSILTCWFKIYLHCISLTRFTFLNRAYVWMIKQVSEKVPQIRILNWHNTSKHTYVILTNLHWVNKIRLAQSLHTFTALTKRRLQP